MRVCSIEGCKKKHYAKRLCSFHYRKENYKRPEVKKKMKEYNRRWTNKNREKYNKKMREWHKKNPEKWKIYQHTTATKKLSKRIENIDWMSVKSKDAFMMDGKILDKRLKEIGVD